MSTTTIDPIYGYDKLSSRIFSILESNFLFGPSHAAPPRARLLSVDASGPTDGLLAAAALVQLESSLRRLSGDPSAAISDFFDLAAGSGAGGVLIALIFSAGLGAEAALRFLAEHRREIRERRRRWGIVRRSGASEVFKAAFGDATLRETGKPVLIACYDRDSGSPFVFSRAEVRDFRVREVCEATMGVAAAEGVVSVDGTRRIAAAAVEGGGAAMGNPAAMAVSHVLNNMVEFPFVRGVDDLMVVSIGNGEVEGLGGAGRGRGCEMAEAMRIAASGASDVVDQAMAVAFGQARITNYTRIQGRILNTKLKLTSELLSEVKKMLTQKNIESVLFKGRKMTEETNEDKLYSAAIELVKEQERRKRNPLPQLITRQGSPQTSSSISSLVSSSPATPLDYD